MTGLNEEKCELLEFGCILDDFNNPLPLEQLPRFHCYFAQEFYTGEPQALSMHPVIFKRIADREPGYTYVSPTRFGNMFKLFLLKNGYKEERQLVYINVAGKNVDGDVRFLQMKTDIDKHVRVRGRLIDPAILYADVKNDEALPGLSECKKRLGIEEKVSHNALDDAIDVIKLLRGKLL